MEYTDSENLLEALLGKTGKGRKELILEATSRTALRRDDWILLPPYKGPAKSEEVDIELGNGEEYQLYRLSDDIGQQYNLAKSAPEKLQEMIKRYREIRGNAVEAQPLKLE